MHFIRQLHAYFWGQHSVVNRRRLSNVSSFAGGVWEGPSEVARGADPRSAAAADEAAEEHRYQQCSWLLRLLLLFCG